MNQRKPRIASARTILRITVQNGVLFRLEKNDTYTATTLADGKYLVLSLGLGNPFTPRPAILRDSAPRATGAEFGEGLREKGPEYRTRPRGISLAYEARRHAYVKDDRD